MTDELLYDLEISIDDGANIEKVEEALRLALLDLYDIETVDSILVRDRTPPLDEDMDELLSVIDRIDDAQIRRSIDLVKELSE